MKTHSLSKMASLLAILVTLASCGGKGDLIIGEGPAAGETQNLNRNEFQIGPSWGALSIDLNTVQNENDFALSRVASSTVKITTFFAKGSGFYVGEYNGQHLVATNAHVLKNIPSCSTFPVIVQFSLHKRAYGCEKVVGIWPEVDFALVTLDVEKTRERDNESFLEELNPLTFNFGKTLEKELPLFTTGHGQINNPESGLTLNRDEDCRIYSPTGTIKRLQDSRREGAKKVPSFAIGCDISPGDSGGPIVDRVNGDVLGVVWSTTIPKSVTLRSESYMNYLRNHNDEIIWKEMAYGVPATEIRAELLRWVERTRRSRPMRKRRELVLSLLGLPLE